MDNQSKNIQGHLLSRSDRSLLAEGLLNVILVQAGERPRFLATMIVEGNKPDLDSKIHILKLGENTAGEVLLSLEGFPDKDHTKFTVVLRDEIWHSLRWLESF